MNDTTGDLLIDLRYARQQITYAVSHMPAGRESYASLDALERAAQSVDDCIARLTPADETATDLTVG